MRIFLGSIGIAFEGHGNGHNREKTAGTAFPATKRQSHAQDEIQ